MTAEHFHQMLLRGKPGPVDITVEAAHRFSDPPPPFPRRRATSQDPIRPAGPFFLARVRKADRDRLLPAFNLLAGSTALECAGVASSWLGQLFSRRLWSISSSLLSWPSHWSFDVSGASESELSVRPKVHFPWSNAEKLEELG